MIVHRHITDPAMQLNTYIVVCNATAAGVLIDPGRNCAAVYDRIEKHRIAVQYIVNTHAHPDHCHGNAQAHERYGAPVLLHAKENRRLDSMAKAKFIPSGEYPRQFIRDGDTLRFGESELKILLTPGHTEGSISLWSGEALFCGDQLKVDPKNDGPARLAFENEQTRDTYGRLLLPLIQSNPEMMIYPGHGPAFKPNEFLTFGAP
jgi:glyoxylase-like metal-dependent hydrolase (beta-lactamase superfamily II)